MTDHVRAGELIPWLANRRLEGEDLVWLNAHLTDCAACQAQLAAEQRVVAALNSHGTVEYAPQPSFKRLWSRIESSGETPEHPDRQVVVSTPQTFLRRGRYLQIAAALLLATALGSLLVYSTGQPPAVYRTVTDPAQPTVAGSLKVIFSDAATMADVKQILGSAGLRVLAGPTEAGVFTVVATATGVPHDLNSGLKTLRNDPRVRFAEPSAGGD